MFVRFFFIKRCGTMHYDPARYDKYTISAVSAIRRKTNVFEKKIFGHVTKLVIINLVINI